MTRTSAPIGDNTVVVSLERSAAVEAAAIHLEAGRSVAMLVADVSVAEETRLKSVAKRARSWLVSPHCLGHAVRPGPIGVVGTAGTGIQEIMCQIDLLGGGVSEALSLGARDLSLDLPEPETFRAIRFMLADPTTAAVVIVLKELPAFRQQAFDSLLRQSTKPVVVCNLGRPGGGRPSGRVVFVSTLEEAARSAITACGGIAPEPSLDLKATAGSERRGLRAHQRWVRGLFSGGSICQEAVAILRDRGLEVASNADRALTFAARRSGGRHMCWDTGLPPFTRPDPTYHPMTTFRPRRLQMGRELSDPETAVILFDVVLGFGSHPSFADVVSPAVSGFRRALARAGRRVAFVAAVVGTEADPQDRATQIARLTAAGVIVAESTSQAATLAAEISIYDDRHLAVADSRRVFIAARERTKIDGQHKRQARPGRPNEAALLRDRTRGALADRVRAARTP